LRKEGNSPERLLSLKFRTLRGLTFATEVSSKQSGTDPDRLFLDISTKCRFLNLQRDDGIRPEMELPNRASE
jgi:hypothetical protein